MKDAIIRRLATLETKRPQRQPRTFVVMPWDLVPAAEPDDMVLHVAFVRPNGQPGGERVAYERTGIHPAEDDPASVNGQRRQATRDAQPWTFRSYPTGASIYMPHNGRGLLEGDRHA